MTPAVLSTSVPFESTLAPTSLAVSPGGEASCDVTVQNTGTVVELLSFEVLGDLAEWASVDPRSINLYPDKAVRGTARVRFQLPRSPLIPPGPRPFGVRVRSQKDPRSTRVEEGTVVVGAVYDVSAELVPRTGRGRRSATYELTLDNRGSVPVNASLSGFDPDVQLRFEFNPPTVVAEPNTAAYARVVVRPKKTFLRGSAKTRQFQIRAQPARGETLAADGTMLHEALLPRWVPRAVLGVAAGAVALALLWATVLKPQIRSSASRAAKKEINSPETQAAIQSAANTAAQAAVSGASAQKLLGTPEAQAAIAASVDKTVEQHGGQTVGLRGSPKDGRLQIGTSLPSSYLVPAGMELQVTDLVFENPKGEAGLLRVLRNDVVLFEIGLENFRDLDYHFAAPLMFGPGDRLRLLADCKGCTPSLSFAAFLAPKAVA